MASPYTWSFATTVGGVDSTPPTVSSTIPVNGAAGVAINSSVTSTFSEAMQSSSINTNTFTVSESSGNIGGTVSYSGTTATFTPSANLDFNTIYKARITTGVRDLAGKAMAADYTWSFTTISLSSTSTPVFTPTPTSTATPKPTEVPTVTLTPLPTPTATPTPGVCEPVRIRLEPRSLSLNQEEMDEVTVTVTGKGGCPVEDETVTATINKAGQKRISISPASAATDESGEAEFTITAKDKPGSAKVTFKAGRKFLEYTVKVRNK